MGKETGWLFRRLASSFITHHMHLITYSTISRSYSFHFTLPYKFSNNPIHWYNSALRQQGKILIDKERKNNYYI